VGQGIIRYELIERQNNEQVQAYDPDLLKTRAAVSKTSLKGVI
jgi:hypothetical protein